MAGLRLRSVAWARTAGFGGALLAVMLLICVAGPLFAPHPIDEPVGPSAMPPGGGHVLGTDYLGRDVLSRVLEGGFSVVALALAGTLLGYAGGLLIGLVAGYRRSLIDSLLMRAVDVLISIPGLLMVLVLVTAVGPSAAVLVAGVALLHLPGISRMVRTATSTTAHRGFVEAAVARGDRTTTVLRREILPNIAHILVADFGLRFAGSVIVIASLNFLNLGLEPPAADWGLMIAENRGIMTLNPWAVLVPALLLALLTISVNLAGDAYLARSGPAALPATKGAASGSRISPG
jgi:peptide/nickel transport system permease protein